MSDTGTDINWPAGDLDPYFRIVDGMTALGQALSNRLTTPFGSLFADRNYGYDVRAQLNARMAETELYAVSANIVNQCMADERVFEVAPTLTFNPGTGVLRVELTGQSSIGPFRFVLSVNEVTVTLLNEAST